MSYRDYARIHLELILNDLQTGNSIRSGESRKYLIDVCERALANEQDPLGMANTRGRQHDSVRRRAIAEKVIDRLEQIHGYMAICGSVDQPALLAGYREACDEVGKGVCLTGSASGAVDKMVKEFAVEIVGVRALYKARNENRAMTEEERELFNKSNKVAFSRAANYRKNRRK